MKNIILLFSILLVASCCNYKGVVPEPIVRIDTVYVTQIKTDTVFINLDRCNDSLLAINDTIAKKLLNANMTINNIKYYVNIVKRNPSQQKFLVGWLNRPLSEYK